MSQSHIKLVGVLMEYAPDDDAKRIVTDKFHAASADCMTKEQIDLMLAQMICDGLHYGNWPWITG